MIRLPSATDESSPIPTICIIKLPIAVPSVGPVTIFLPVYSAVSSFKSSFLLPPPMMFNVS